MWRLTTITKLFLIALGITQAANIWAQVCRDDIVKSTPNSHFQDNGNGTVTHTKTGLMWMQCSEGQTHSLISGKASCTGTATTHNWKAALELADKKTFAEYSDWRLPNVKELSSIVERACYNPTINESYFPNNPTPGQGYWSSTFLSDSFSNEKAWHVFFLYGGTGVSARTNLNHLRLVRGGQ